MSKKVLIITTVSGFVPQFEMNNVKILQELGYEVHYASNYNMPFYGKDNSRLEGTGIIQHQVDFERSPLRLKRNFKAFLQLRRLQGVEDFEVVHCHTPMGGALGRIVFGILGKGKTRILYTAHGFHFFRGASLKNWLLYYPIEKFLSKWTDVLITINKEDYALAKKKMYAKKVEYVPGVGIDKKKFGTGKKEENRERIRAELGIPKEAKLLLSVGELNENKNHETIIRALAKLPEIKGDKIYYAITGEGELGEKLKELIRDLSLENQVFLLGFREDMVAIYNAADVFAFPSKREGLPVALMEAMASGLPVICSKIRGNVDLIDEGMGGCCFKTSEVKQIAEAFNKIIDCDLVKMGLYNRKKISKFALEEIIKRNEKIYRNLDKENKMVL